MAITLWMPFLIMWPKQLWALGYKQFKGLPLIDFPVAKKTDHRLQTKLYRTDSTNGHRIISTSGTTGKSLPISFDPADWYSVNFHFYRQVITAAGIDLGRFTSGQPGVLFITNKPERRSTVAILPSLNDSLYIRLNIEEIDQWGDGISDRLSKFKAPIIYGKPTYLLNLVSLLEERGIDPATIGKAMVLTSGERLYADVRARLEDAFEIPLHDAYASTEGGLIAISCPHGHGMHIQSENVMVEVLDRDKISLKGFGEILVTNMTNWTTAFIRYQSGDLGHLASKCECGHQDRVLKHLWGRDPKQIEIQGQLFQTDELCQKVISVPGIYDFQLSWNSSGVVLRWQPDNLSASSTTETALTLRLRAFLPVPLRLEMTQRITKPGGKIKRFLPLKEIII